MAPVSNILHGFYIAVICGLLYRCIMIHQGIKKGLLRHAEKINNILDEYTRFLVDGGINTWASLKDL